LRLAAAAGRSCIESTTVIELNRWDDCWTSYFIAAAATAVVSAIAATGTRVVPLFLF